MGNELPRQSSSGGMTSNSADPKDGLQRRRASATEIQDLFSALQGLVPAQARSQSTSPCLPIPEETRTSTIERDGMQTSNTSPGAQQRSCPSSPQSSKSRPAEKCKFTKSQSFHTLIVNGSPKVSRRSPVPRRGSLADRVSKSPSPKLGDHGKQSGKEHGSSRSEYLRKELDKPEAGSLHKLKMSSKRRGSLGDALETREKMKVSSPRRRSIGGSLLLDAIKSTSSSPRQNSLADALHIIAHKTDVKELIKSCEERVQKELKGLDETDSRKCYSDSSSRKQSSDIEDQMEMLLNSISELQQDVEDYPLDQEAMLLPDFTRRTSVGTEMQDLLAALRELALTGDASPAMSSRASPTSSLSESMAEITGSPHKESLEDLEAYFMEKLHDISKERPPVESSTIVGERPKDGAVCEIPLSVEPSRQNSNSIIERDVTRHPEGEDEKANNDRLVNAQKDEVHCKEDVRSKGLRSSSTHGTVCPANTRIITKPQPAKQYLKQGKIAKVHDSKLLSVSSQTHLRTISPLDLATYPKEQKEQQTDEESKALRDQSSLARSRAEWKEDQLLFAKQVNDRLEEWLTRATALSKQSEKDKVLLTKSDVNAESTQSKNKTNSPHPKQLPRSATRFNFKMSMKGRTKRSKSLYNALDPEELNVKAEAKSQIQRTPPASRAFSRFRLPRSKSIHVAKHESQQKGTDSPNNTYKSDKPNSIEISTVVMNSSGVTSKKTRHERRNGWKKSSKVRRSLSDRTMTYYNEDPKEARTLPALDRNTTIVTNNRVPRLPVDLPLFYTPGMEKSSAPQLSKEKSESHIGVVTGDKNVGDHSESFYTVSVSPGKTDCESTDLEAQGSFLNTKTRLESANARHLLSVPAGMGQTPGLRCNDRYKYRGVVDESCKSSNSDRSMDQGVMDESPRSSYSDGVLSQGIMMESPRSSYSDGVVNHGWSYTGGVIDCFFRNEDFAGYRDGTKSESDDSGCPANDPMIGETGVPTEAASPYPDQEGASRARSAEFYARSLYDLDSETFEI